MIFVLNLKLALANNITVLRAANSSRYISEEVLRGLRPQAIFAPNKEIWKIKQVIHEQKLSETPDQPTKTAKSIVIQCNF